VFAKASVIGPIHVGDRAVVGAHALVLDDVPPDSTARGLPAVSFPRAPRQPDG
jgi:serine O-acetyltransferase